MRSTTASGMNLMNRRLQAGHTGRAVVHLDPGQATRAVDALTKLRVVVDFLARQDGHRPGPCRAATRPSVSSAGPAKHLEVDLRCMRSSTSVTSSMAIAQVRLVGAIARHGLGIAHVRKVAQFDTEHLAEQLADHALGDVHHTSASSRKESLDVDLRELRLPVGAQILVAEALGDLVVAVEARDHEQLLEQLRRLRQRKEMPGDACDWAPGSRARPRGWRG
jgi:hypothetical protein